MADSICPLTLNLRSFASFLNFELREDFLPKELPSFASAFCAAGAPPVAGAGVVAPVAGAAAAEGAGVAGADGAGVVLAAGDFAPALPAFFASYAALKFG